MATLGSKPIDELVRLAIIGDGAAFTQLWDTHISSLRGYLKKMSRQLDDFYVDDICSRSFEKAFRQIRSFDPSRSQFSTWLKVIAHNTALDVMESEARAQGGCVRLDEDERQAAAIENIGDDVATVLENIISEEDSARTENLVEGLPDLYREVARLRLINGYKYNEIAEETGLELNTVRTRLRRAKAIMEKMKTQDNAN